MISRDQPRTRTQPLLQNPMISCFKPRTWMQPLSQNSMISHVWLGTIVDARRTRVVAEPVVLLSGSSC